MKLLSGNKLASKILDRVALESKKIHDRGITPTLAVILIGDDPASRLYISKKKEVAKSVGIDFLLYELPESISENDVTQLLTTLHLDETVHGVVLQLPLPEKMNLEKIIKFIDIDKDVDCFHKNSPFSPPTANSVLELIRFHNIDINNKNIAIIGKGFLVGKPLEILLKKANAKVETYDEDTKNIAQKASKADILISATGKPKLVNKSFTNPDQIIIDVGSARDPKTNKIVGDVDRVSIGNSVKAITPLVGGIGPVTVALLMRNVITAVKTTQST